MSAGPSQELSSLTAALSQVTGLAEGAPPAPESWDRWYALAARHQVTPLLGARLEQLNLPGLPDGVREELFSDYQLEARAALHRISTLGRVLEALEESFEFVVLKGWALLGELYRDAGERPSWDVDRLFRTREEAEEAEARLERLGFQRTGSTQEHHHLPALTAPGEGLGVELHFDLTMPPLGKDIIGRLWAHTVERETQDGQRFRVLDPVARLVSLCVHALNDPIDAPLLRHLLEVGWAAEALSKPERDTLQELVKATELDGICTRALHLARGAFPHARPAGRAARYRDRALVPPQLGLGERSPGRRTLAPGRGRASHRGHPAGARPGGYQA